MKWYSDVVSCSDALIVVLANSLLTTMIGNSGRSEGRGSSIRYEGRRNWEGDLELAPRR